MRACVYERFGGPEVLAWAEVPDPEPGPGQVLVRTRAAGVNYGDAKAMEGSSSRARLPGIPGLEFAGTVAALGQGVTALAVGDEVFGRAERTCAELLVAEAEDCVPRPQGLPPEQAAVSVLGYQTAWHGLVTVAGLTAGRHVYSVPAGGAVGSAAVQICRALGAPVLAGVGSAEKAAAVAALWAPDAVVDYRHGDVAAAAAAFSGGEGCAIAIDGLGAPTFAASLATLGYGGRLLVYGAPEGGSLCTRVKDLAYANLSVTGFAVTDRRFPETRAAYVREVLPRLLDGTFHTTIAARFPLPEVARAHRMLHEHRHLGRLVLVTGG